MQAHFQKNPCNLYPFNFCIFVKLGDAPFFKYSADIPDDITPDQTQSSFQIDYFVSNYGSYIAKFQPTRYFVEFSRWRIWNNYNFILKEFSLWLCDPAWATSDLSLRLKEHQGIKEYFREEFTNFDIVEYIKRKCSICTVFICSAQLI